MVMGTGWLAKAQTLIILSSMAHPSIFISSFHTPTNATTANSDVPSTTTVNGIDLVTSFLTIVILGVGLNAKPDLTIEAWAYQKALERTEAQKQFVNRRRC
ncbi:hypothetical protein QVD17_40132 [Tagetes erecta]|uniref:Uncharacterized protein n=1 Tax=Tagetes erecta TaxID=13708 RepID=A0AAD8JPM2_TARER|nr:hypothetical protein QVD17_40132 [Tagetes erecta]